MVQPFTVNNITIDGNLTVNDDGSGTYGAVNATTVNAATVNGSLTGSLNAPSGTIGTLSGTTSTFTNAVITNGTVTSLTVTNVNGGAWVADSAPQPAECGYYGWTYDAASLPAGPTGVVLSTGGRTLLWKIPVRQAATVSTLRVYIVTAGTASGLTSGANFSGLYSSAGSLLATSADQTTPWSTPGNANAFLDMQLNGGTPITVSPPFVWASVLGNANNNGTLPSFARTTNQSASYANGILPNTTARYGFVPGSVSTLAASFAPGTISTASAVYWAAIY